MRPDGATLDFSLICPSSSFWVGEAFFYNGLRVATDYIIITFDERAPAFLDGI